MALFDAAVKWHATSRNRYRSRMNFSNTGQLHVWIQCHKPIGLFTWKRVGMEVSRPPPPA